MESIHTIIGRYDEPLLWWQMVCRAVFIFLYLLLLYRVGDKRAFGKNAGFDIVLGVLLGSTLSRCLTGNAPFWPTLAACGARRLMHMGLAKLARWSPTLGQTVKGEESRLVQDGVMLEDNMRAGSITEHDLKEAIRLHGKVPDLRRVKCAYLERNGDISIVAE